MLVSEVIERAYSEWLYPSGINRPMYDKLASGIDASTLTIPLAGRARDVPRDTILEIGSEQILVDSVSGTVVTAKERGWLQTDAASHSSGDIVWVDPTFTRLSLFDAIVTVMGLLYPAGVYARAIDSTTTFSYSSPTKNLPAGGKKLLKIAVRDTGSVERWNTLRPGLDYRELLEFSPPKYELLYGGSEGATMQIVYKADMTRPTSEADDLSSLVAPTPVDLQPHLPMGIAGHVLQGREVPRVLIEEIKRRLASEGVQVGQALNVGQALLNQFMGRYVAAERDRLKETDAVGLEFSRR